MDPKIDKKRGPEPDRVQGRSRGGPVEAFGGFWKHFGWVFEVIVVRFFVDFGARAFWDYFWT